MTSHKLCHISQLKDGFPETFNVGDLPVVLINLGNRIYAFSQVCPHAGGDLAQGRFEQNRVTCLNHGACFDLDTGKLFLDNLDEDFKGFIDPDNPPFGPLTLYRTRVEVNEVILELD